jgi:hypothetical protein
MGVEENLSKVLTCPIAYNELINRSLIQLPTVEKVTAHLKEAVKKTGGIKKIKELQNIAQTSIGVTLGAEGAKIRLKVLLENYHSVLVQGYFVLFFCFYF